MLVLLYSKLIWVAFGRPFSFLVGARDEVHRPFLLVRGGHDLQGLRAAAAMDQEMVRHST